MAGITLIQKLQKLFGARAVSDMMGRTTNVQTLAQGTNNPFRNAFSPKYLANNPDGVEEASKVILENMQYAFGNRNIQQMKNFENNVNTLYDLKFPVTATKSGEAKVIDITTKKKVTGEGLDSLKDDLGLPEDIPPTSPLGESITKAKRIDKTIDQKAKEYSVMNESFRRPLIRDMLLNDKRINLPENIRKSLKNREDLQRGADPMMDPLQIFQKYYNYDVKKLEQFEDIANVMSIAGFRSDEIAKAFIKRGGLEPRNKKIIRESLDDETVEMTEKNLLDNSDDDIPFAQGGIAGQLHMNQGGSVTKPKRGLVNEAGSYAGVKKVREGKTYDVISSQLLDPTFDLMDLEELKDILKSLGVNYKTGGRVGLEKGGPPNKGRRNFMKLMAGLASIPVLGKFFKLAKPAAKITQLKNTSTAMPEWFPKFIDKFINNSVGKKIDADLMEFKNSDLPNIKVTKHDDGRVYVEGNNEFNEGYAIDYTPPGYAVVDEKTGKAVKTAGDFEAVEGRHVALSPEDYDTDAFYVDDLDELTTIDVAEMEKYSTGKVTKTVKDAFKQDTGLKKGMHSYDMAVGKAENQADVLKDADLLDEDLAKGGRVGLLSGGGILKAMLKNLAKEKRMSGSEMLAVMNYKALPSKIRNLMTKEQFEQLKSARLKGVKNFKDMMQNRLDFNKAIQQGKAVDDKGTGMSKIFDLLEEDFGKKVAVPKNITEKDILQMEQMIKNMETKGRKLNAKGGLAGQLKL
jgi:hypothetical protein